MLYFLQQFLRERVVLDGNVVLGTTFLTQKKLLRRYQSEKQLFCAFNPPANGEARSRDYTPGPWRRTAR